MPKPFFSDLHFNQSVNVPGFRNPPFATWPKEWSTIHFKSYPRSRRFALAPSQTLRAPLHRVLSTRASRRDTKRKLLSPRQLSDLIFWSAGLQPIKRTSGLFGRMYASGGARFPLELYLVILTGPLPKGLYHYNVPENSLELLWEHDLRSALTNLFIGKEVMGASVIFFVTAVFERNQVKYSERGYRYIFVEAGHLGQNMYLVAESLGLKCCAVGGFYDAPVNKLLDIDGTHEAVIYSLAIGK